MKKFIIIFCISLCFASQNEWGDSLSGVIKTIPNPKNEKILALSLDLCGGKTDGFDERLVEFLEKNDIKATFFVSYQWIKKYPKYFERIYKNPLFEIENHGTKHKPASVDGKSIYGLKGTKNLAELSDEINKNANLIAQITLKRPKFYRSGGAYYDKGAIKQIYKMGFKPIGFSILADGGATFSANRIKKEILKSKNGDIIIAHANRPQKQTAQGLILGISILRANGFEFVRLDEVLE